jgi:hypothetical protein
MGLKFETAVGEAYDVWYDDAVTPLEKGVGDRAESSPAPAG